MTSVPAMNDLNLPGARARRPRRDGADRRRADLPRQARRSASAATRSRSRRGGRSRRRRPDDDAATHAGRYRRRRPGRPDAVAPAAPRGHRVGRPREPRPRVRRAARARRRAGAGHGRSARRSPASASACSARAWCITASSCASTAAGHRIDMTELTGGRAITVYGQQEVVKDLIARAARRTAAPILFEVDRTSRSHDIETDAAVDPLPRTAASDVSSTATSSPAATASTASAARPSRAGVLSVFERVYPFAWLASSREAPPRTEELIYAYHDRGFALLQHALAGDHAPVPAVSRPTRTSRSWPDDRIWDELHTRLETGDGWKLDRRADPREGRHRHAQLRGRADAAWPAVPGRRRRAHRAADRRQGHEPRDRRRARAGARARRVLRATAASDLMAAYSRHVPDARLARRALLVVDDVDAAPLPGDDALRPPPAALASSTTSSAPRGGDERSPRTTSACPSTIENSMRPTDRFPP